MELLTFLWFVDNSMSAIFFKNKISYRRLPEEIELMNEQEFYQVQSRIIDFKTKILFEKDAEINLSKVDINVIFNFFYDDYRNRILGDRVFDLICFFDIENDEIIINEIALFLIFNFNPLYIKKVLKFELIDGKIREFKKTVKFLESGKSDEYIFVKDEFATNLIHRILVSSESNSMDKFKQKITMASSRVIAEPLIKRLKSVQVLNGFLVLRA